MKADSSFRGLFVISLILLFGSAFAVVVAPRTTTVTEITPSIVPNLSVSNTSTVRINEIDLALSQSAINAANYVLKSGPMVYVAATPARVIDSSTRKVVSTIKSGEENSYIDAIGVSPDAQFVYISVSWAVYEADYYGGHYNKFTRVVRLNASTQTPIDQFSFDGIRPEHMKVAPDGRVYLSFQEYGYPEHGGIKIMDFSAGKSWYLDYDEAMMINSFDFSHDGSHAYYAAWWGWPGIYDLDWSVNKVHYYKLPGNTSYSNVYTRSIAVANGGKMIYAVVNGEKGIFAMNLEDKNKQIIPTTYYPVLVSASPDGNTLYAIGYVYDSNDKPLYMVHKYGGLKTVGPFYTDLFDYSLSTKETFYTTDALSYITSPKGYPSYMTVTPDGKYGYLTTTGSDSASNFRGDYVLVYDLQYMNQLPSIEMKNSGLDIVAASDKITFSPQSELDLAKQFSPNMIQVTLDPNKLYIKKVYPSSNTFASQYTSDLFVIDAIFTDKLDNKTVNSTTFRVTEKSGTPVPGHVSSALNIAMFLPNGTLKPNTDYIVYLSKGIKSVNGSPLYTDVNWSFNTRNSTEGQITNISIVISSAKLISSAKIGLTFDQNVSQNKSLNRSWTPGRIGPTTQNQTNNASSQNQTIPNEPPQTQTTPGGKNDPTEQNQPPGQVNPGTSPNPVVSPELNPQPEPPVPAVSPELNPQPEPPAPSANPNLNPQPEPPAPGGFFDGIINFFKSLFGMK